MCFNYRPFFCRYTSDFHSWLWTTFILSGRLGSNYYFSVGSVDRRRPGTNTGDIFGGFYTNKIKCLKKYEKDGMTVLILDYTLPLNNYSDIVMLMGDDKDDGIQLIIF